MMVGTWQFCAGIPSCFACQNCWFAHCSLFIIGLTWHCIANLEKDSAGISSSRLLIEADHVSGGVAEAGSDLRRVGADWLSDLASIGDDLL